MKFDFSVPMTFYEFLAIILAVVAIVIPVGQAIWKKWIVKGKLVFLPTGRVALFFNQSGSYIRIDGVYEARNKAISVKNISAKVIRQKDDRALNLSWSSFISPVNQNMVGAFIQTTETAHPFRIEMDSIASAFTEFGDSTDSFGKKFRTSTSSLFKHISEIRKTYSSYDLAVAQYKNLHEYRIARTLLEKEFFWEIGKYSIEITAKYGKTSANFKFEFSVGAYEHNSLVENIDEALCSPLKSAYNIGYDYHTAFIEMQNKQ